LFAAWFKQALLRHGIKVNGKTRTMNWLAREVKPLARDKMVELGWMESLPMREIAKEVMKPSQNLYTDLLLAQVGERARNGGETGTSEDLGIAELKKFLKEAGVKDGDVLFEEGSGLSRNNLTTPNATIALLQFMHRHPNGSVYVDSFPVAGVDGTLKNRMKGTVAAGNLRAKTGTLRWANALSGHVTSAAGEHLIFSIMLNRYHAPEGAGSGRAELDAIATMLAGLADKTQN
jgi:D-alanyl-D-alanine carboxypeptidase/D-alanyl-D-alanine-endopeptidase (penicillin-binding protein 4)